MTKESVRSDATLTVSFEGKHSIEASLLGRTALNFAQIVNRISELGNGSMQCELEVKALQAGSFEAVFQFALTSAITLAPTVITSAKGLVDIIKTSFEVKKMLKGERPKVEGSKNGFVEIFAPDGTHVRVPCGHEVIITDPMVDRSVSEIAQAAHIFQRSMRLIDDVETVKYEDSDLRDIAKQQSTSLQTDAHNRTVEHVSLPIKKIDLLGESKWSFLYGRRTIHANITDQVFLNSVHNGSTSYKSGDMLEVELLVSKRYSEDGQLQSEKYEIVKVFNVISQMTYSIL